MKVETVIDVYKQLGNVKGVAKALHLSDQKVRKILITYDMWDSERCAVFNDLYQNNISIKEIAKIYNLTTNAVISYLPYQRCVYNLDEPTQNALNIRKFKARKNAGQS